MTQKFILKDFLESALGFVWIQFYESFSQKIIFLVSYGLRIPFGISITTYPHIFLLKETPYECLN